MRAAAALFLLSLAGSAVAAQSGSETVYMTVSKRAEIGFTPGIDTIPAVIRPRLRALALQLKAQLNKAVGMIEIEAYAPDPHSRILAVQRLADLRLALVDAGLPAERITVRVQPSGGGADTITIWLRRRR